MERIELNPSKSINEICWSNIDWKEVELYVERLQGRIYKATDKKDFKLVINLQKLTTYSEDVENMRKKVRIFHETDVKCYVWSKIRGEYESDIEVPIRNTSYRLSILNTPTCIWNT